MLLPLGKLIRHRRTPWRGAKVSQRLQREWSPQKRQDQSTCGENQRAETKTSSAAKKWQFDLTIKIAKHLWIGQLWAAHPKKIFKRIRDNLSPRHQLPHPLQSPVLLPRPFLGLRLRPSSPGKLEMVQWLGSLKGSSSLELTPKINRTIFKKIWWPKKTVHPSLAGDSSKFAVGSLKSSVPGTGQDTFAPRKHGHHHCFWLDGPKASVLGAASVS